MLSLVHISINEYKYNSLSPEYSEYTLIDPWVSMYLMKLCNQEQQVFDFVPY